MIYEIHEFLKRNPFANLFDFVDIIKKKDQIQLLSIFIDYIIIILLSLSDI